jgi:hypothetical protein
MRLEAVFELDDFVLSSTYFVENQYFTEKMILKMPA